MKHILVVDDNIAALKIFERTAQNTGAQVAGFQSGEEALRWAQNDPPDLGIFDYSLPGISGADLLKKFKTDKRFEKAPIIIVTGHRGINFQEKLFKLGASSVFIKPFSPIMLSKKICDLLKE